MIQLRSCQDTRTFLFYDTLLTVLVDFQQRFHKNQSLTAEAGLKSIQHKLFRIYLQSREEKKKIDGLKIGIVGDLKYGRTVYSLLHGLCNYNVDVHLISPESLKIRKDSTYDIKKKLSYTESTSIDEYIDDLDVLYVTRIQKERFPDEEEYIKMRGSYVIGLDVVKKMKEDAIILHPLPRIDEISTDVDSSKQAKYFEQAEYGKYTRAALLRSNSKRKRFLNS